MLYKLVSILFFLFFLLVLCYFNGIYIIFGDKVFDVIVMWFMVGNCFIFVEYGLGFWDFFLRVVGEIKEFIEFNLNG